MAPSASPLDRLPKILSTRYEAQRDVWADSWRASDTVPEEAALWAVSLDGVMAPMAKSEIDAEGAMGSVAPETGEKVAGQSPAKRHDREASCGTVSLYDAQGQRLSPIRYGRMPASKKVT